MKTYEIHHKGQRPFSVEVDEHELRIYTQLWDNENEYWAIHKLIYHTPYVRIFIGDNQLQLDGFARKGLYPGNSILAQLSDQVYLWIGSYVCTFEVEDEIQSFFSPIGESDLSYPYAIGKKEVYFFLDPVKIPTTIFDSALDGYEQRYHSSLEQSPFMIKTIYPVNN